MYDEGETAGAHAAHAGYIAQLAVPAVEYMGELHHDLVVIVVFVLLIHCFEVELVPAKESGHEQDKAGR